MTVDDIEQVEVILCEDGKTIMVIGYASDDDALVQSFDMPIVIDEAFFLEDEWREAARYRPDEWRTLYG